MCACERERKADLRHKAAHGDRAVVVVFGRQVLDGRWSSYKTLILGKVPLAELPLGLMDPTGGVLRLT